MASRTVSVQLVADVGQYQSAMQKAAATTKSVGDAATDSGSRMSRGFGTARAGAALLGGVLAGGLALGVKSVIGAASDLNETLNKSNVIFGQNSGQIEKWAGSAAKNLGLSKQAALEAASSLGNMFQQLGFTGEQATKSSTSVVKLAADLGSFNNLETGDVLERIQAAFRGEYDSLQLLIPNINAARVEQEAMAETGKTNAAALTAQEKATAVLAIVQKDGAAAANDFAETSDGLANSTKIAAAQFEDLKSRIGQDLLPVAQSTMHFFSETALPAIEGLYGGVKSLAGGFMDLPGPMQAAIVAGGIWAVAGDRITGILGKIGTGLSPMRDGWRAFGQAMDYARANGDGLGTVLKSVGDYAGGQALSGIKALGRAIGPELAVAAGAFVIGNVVSGIRSLTEASDDAKAAAEGLAQALTLTDTAADRRSIRRAIEDTDGLIEVLQKAGVSSETAINGLLGQKSAQDEVNAALQRYIGTVNTRGDDGAESVRQASLAYDELATGYGNAASNARFFGDSATDAASSSQGAADATTAASQQSIEAAKAAQDAMQQWIDKLAGIDDAFVDPLGTYQTMLQTAAQATADATSSAKDSWQDYADSASVSLDEYAQKLQDQITAQQNWATNLGIIAQRAGLDVAQHLAEMGTDGVQLVAQMANGSDAEMQRMAGLLRQDAQLAGSGAATALDTQMKVMALIGSQGAAATAQGIATQLNIGVGEVAAIARQYGSNLAGGINPILASLGKPQVTVGGGGGRAIGQAVLNADGNLYEDHQAEIAPGGAWRVWAEPETGGEAYIPLAASKRPRSRTIASETVERLGGQVQWFANGGFTSEADVPRPPSTAPYRLPISTAGDAAMDTAFQATSNFVRENGPWARALAWAKSQVGKPYIWGGVGPAGFDCSGFQSAITNVILGRNPYSRIGATATFPWKGFAPGDGVYTVGSTKNAGGGIGHMAGTLMGVNVESRGGQGVVVGASARGAHNGLFGTVAHLAMANGGVIGEPVVGVGTRSGNSYSFAERGPEVVLPTGREMSGGGGIDYKLLAAALKSSSRTLIGEYHQTVVSGSPYEAMDELEHRLRVADLGGKYAT